MTELPTTKGQTAELWSDHESRIIIECHGDAWTLRGEYSDGCALDEDGPNTWTEGAVPLDGWRRCWSDLLLALRPYNDIGAQILREITNGSNAMPIGSKFVKVARARGWWVDLYNGDGSHELLIGVRMKRPLSGAEFIAFLGRFAAWLDATEKAGWS